MPDGKSRTDETAIFAALIGAVIGALLLGEIRRATLNYAILIREISRLPERICFTSISRVVSNEG